MQHWCDTLWTIIVGCQSSRVDELDASPAARACLVNLSQSSVLRCTLAFKVYHALRMDYRHVVDQAVFTGNFQQVHSVAFDLCRFFLKDLSDIR